MLQYVRPNIDAATTLSGTTPSRPPAIRRTVERCTSNVLARFAIYDSHAPNFVRLPRSPFGSTRSHALRHCYSRGRKSVEELMAALEQAQSAPESTVCPMCGFGDPTTGDHVLPKAEFPEYSVYPPNLVPICSRCNTIKGKRWRGPNGRLFLNPYFDTVPTARFLHATVLSVSARGADIEFRIDPPASVPVPIAGLLLRHFDTLGLQRRYMRKSVSSLTEWGRTAARVRNRRHAYFRSELTKKRDSLEDNWGPNHYEVALTRALMQSNNYIDYLVGIAAGTIPRP